MFAEIIPIKRGPLMLPFFDYSVPTELQADLAIGQLVLIPFRGTNMFGIVKKITEHSTAKKLLPITSIVNQRPLLSEKYINFLCEFSEFYSTSLGSLAKSSLLPLQKRKLKKLSTETASQGTSSKFGKPLVFMYGSDTEKKTHLESMVSAPGQHLIIVPEIADALALHELLTPDKQTESCIISSDTSIKETFDLWQAVWTGEKRIIIGTRRALFLSFNNLQTITIDNESAENHKSWDSAPRFHAREAALMLGKHLGAAVTLMGHRPLAETYYFVKKNIYSLASQTLLPEIKRLFEVVNPKLERRGGNFSPLSDSLQEALTQHGSGTIFLYCNRRGTGGFSMCRDCKTVAQCPRCARALTYHQENQELRCHRCGHTEPYRETCAKCHGANLTVYSPGTAAIVQEIKKLLPNEKRPIIQIDSDSLELTLPATDCIIVGTQAAWRFIPWRKISLLAFMDADTPLFVPEYRMAESIWQLINEARYRIPVEAELIIQTNHPEHAVFANITNPTAFYEQELRDRKLFNYPPYSYLLKLFYRHQNKEEAAGEAKRIFAILQRLTKPEDLITINPPQSFFPAYYRGFYWQAIIIKLPLARYKELAKLLLKHTPPTWKVDPNPSTLLSI